MTLTHRRKAESEVIHVMDGDSFSHAPDMFTSYMGLNYTTLGNRPHCPYFYQCPDKNLNEARKACSRPKSCLMVKNVLESELSLHDFRSQAPGISAGTH